ncbi:hypothetical protein HRbin15_01400 [bacterium HR15]|nr:hypothetical protein HRbin15_01400 [bacterium HR15]
MLLAIGVWMVAFADWQWEKTLPLTASWVLGSSGEAYLYAYYAQPPQQQPHQQVLCINSDGSERWRIAGLYQDSSPPRFFLAPSVSGFLNTFGLVAPAIAVDSVNNEVHVLVGAYPPAFSGAEQLPPTEIVYARIRAGELVSLRTIAPTLQYLFAYGIYQSNDNIYLLYTGYPVTYQRGFVSECQTSSVGDWFGGIICNTMIPNRKKWQGQFIGRSLKLLNRYDSVAHDQIPHCLPPMGAADVDQAGNVLMVFYPVQGLLDPYTSYSTDFDKRDRVIIYVNNAGEVVWSRKITALGEQRSPQILAPPYRVWARLGANYGFMAEMIDYQDVPTAVIYCFSKSNGALILSEKWSAKDLIGIVQSGDRCYVGLVRATCQSCAESLCTEVWEVSPTTGIRRIACHPGRGLAIAFGNRYIGVLLQQSCSSQQGIKIQLWDTSGVPYWSAIKCLGTSGFPIGGELQLRWTTVVGNRRRLDVGARVMYFVNFANHDQGSVLAKGQWEFVGDE